MLSLALPAVLVSIAAVVLFNLLDRRFAARIAVTALLAAIGITALMTWLVTSELDESATQRCPIEETAYYGYLALLLASAALAGVVVAAAVSAARLRGGVAAWHVLAGLVAVVLPFVVLAEFAYLGLSCST